MRLEATASAESRLAADETETEREVLREILRSIRSVRYGSIEVVIHEARVVQIERKEKIRFERRTPRASVEGVSR